MGAAIGQSLPIAIGVLISPLPIVAVVLMLLSRRAKANASAFLLGWFLAIGAVAMLVALAAGAVTPRGAGPPAWAGWVKIVLGALLLFVALRQWQGRPRRGVEPPTPTWMAAIDGFAPVKALGLAVLLGAVNPKNLLLVVSGGAAIAATAPGDTTAQVTAVVVFATLASIGVSAPLVTYLSMGARAGVLLEDLKNWMIRYNAIIMATLLLVIAAKMIGDGLTAL